MSSNQRESQVTREPGRATEISGSLSYKNSLNKAALLHILSGQSDVNDCLMIFLLTSFLLLVS